MKRLNTMVSKLQQSGHEPRLSHAQTPRQHLSAPSDLLSQGVPHLGATRTHLSASTRAECSRCQGAGFLRSDVPLGHPHFGKPVACHCKEQEIKHKRQQQLKALSNLDLFAEKRFETFDPSVPGMQHAFRMAVAFAVTPAGWFLLVGPNGCGKTHLAAAIAHACLEAGAVVFFTTVPDLLDHLRATFAPTSSVLYDQRFALMREAELLALDDLGTQQSSPWADEKLFQLLNSRYNAGLPTVITANLAGVRATDGRLRSRLSDLSLVIALSLEQVCDYRSCRTPRDW